MNGNGHRTVRSLARVATFLVCATFVFGDINSAWAQSTPPPDPPGRRTLPDGAGTMSLGEWLLYPTLSLRTFADSNVYSTPTSPISTVGLNIRPSLLADYDTGIHETSLYGNISSTIYPFIDYTNNTFDRQAGFIEKYEAMRDLIFTVHGDYTHLTNANVLNQSIPGPILSPATPGPQGAAGVTAFQQQTTANPNDTYTGTGTIYKEFNRAYASLSGSVATTQYANQSLATNFNTDSYSGGGGFWFTPLLYAYANGAQAFQFPAVGLNSNAYQVRTGIGSARIGLFSGSVYFGHQGSEVDTAGTAGGDIYGGAISYFPTAAWDVNFSVNRITNISNITSAPGTPLALAGAPLAAAPIPTNASVRVTALSFGSNYRFSEQTSVFGVLSYTRTSYLDTTQLDNSWLASIGIRHELSAQLELSFDYSFTSFVSNQPGTSYIKNYTALGATYRF